MLKTVTKGAAALFLLGTAAEAQTSPAWGYNSYGVPGMIDMPGALSRPDAELAFSVSHFRNTTRNSATFQLTNRLSGSFRYSLLHDLVSNPGETFVYDYIYDRSFSFHFRVLDEGRYMPAVAVGLNDIIGTGIYGGEYIVATKTLTPRLRATAGLGWGRLAGIDSFSNPLGFLGDSWDTRPTDRGAQGGTFEPDTWFHGDAALFGGFEWQATDKLRFVAEYSSDAYLREDGYAFERESPFNFGVSYQVRQNTTVSANYLYGSELGLQVNFALNPKNPTGGSGFDSAPPPIVPRSALAGVSGQTGEAATRLQLEALNIRLNAVQISGTTATVEVENAGYSITSQALGRTARVLTRTMPASVDTFVIVLADSGIPVSSVALRRGDLELLEFAVDAPAQLLANSRIGNPPPTLPTTAERFPRFSAKVAPYLEPSYFDPDEPVRAEVGIGLTAGVEPFRGMVLSGTLRQSLYGNLSDSERISDSPLPRVRSDGASYDREGETALSTLTAAYFFSPAPEVFGRVTLGYLEPMFAGVSTELLWKPVDARYALGVEVNRVKQRDFDQRLGLQDYEVTTGHVSGYYDIGNGFQTRLDVGQYLAGDVGATLTVAREFENGWRIGVFATKTDVSSEEFGEGSFDKGIEVRMPLQWLTGKPTSDAFSTVLRPVQRDGGARLDVAGRLYEKVRPLQGAELSDSWARFWR